MPALEMYYKFQAEVQGAPLAIKYGGVAQSVERRISNERDLEKSQTATLTICIQEPCVAGSSPASPATGEFGI